jgi:DNA-binding NtrC family response regulator
MIRQANGPVVVVSRPDPIGTLLAHRGDSPQTIARDAAELLLDEGGLDVVTWDGAPSTLDAIADRFFDYWQEEEWVSSEPMASQAPGLRATLRSLARALYSEGHIAIWGEPGIGRMWLAALAHRVLFPHRPLDFGVNEPGETQLWRWFGRRRVLECKPDAAFAGLFFRGQGTTSIMRDVELLDFGLQARIARSLMEGEYRLMDGESDAGFGFPIEGRVIATFGGPPDELFQQGKLHPNLYQDVFSHWVFVPPLRKRREDIPFIVKRIIADAHREAGEGILLPEVSEEVMDDLREREWPGNVAELKFVVENALAVAGGGKITRGTLRSWRGPLGVVTP